MKSIEPVQSPESYGLERMQSAFMRSVYDPEFRSLMVADPREAMSSKGMPPPPPGVEVRVHVNTPDTFHVVFPEDPNVALSDESLGMVAGGKTVGTGGCASSASTLGCVCSTASTATTASTLATAGSAGS